MLEWLKIKVSKGKQLTHCPYLNLGLRRTFSAKLLIDTHD